MAKSVRELDKLLLEVNKKLGGEYTFEGKYAPKGEPISTGILSLDLALGTGGWPTGAMIGVYGPKDIGKSSIVGLGTIKNAQAMGKNVAIVAMEPTLDEHWLEKNGVDPQEIAVVYPDTIENAFRTTHFLLTNDTLPIDLVVFDSVGAGLTESEIFGTSSSEAKAKQGGQAGTITWGVKLINHALKVRKMQPVVLLINQIRINMSSQQGGYVQAGGEALKHHESIIVKLMRGQDKESVKIDDSKDGTVQIMQEVVATIERNKHNEGTGQTARWNFYNKEIPGYPFGVDTAADIVNTASRFGIVKKSGAYFYLPSDPDKGVQGMKKVREHFEEHPEEREQIRKLVLEKMNGTNGNN